MHIYPENEERLINMIMKKDYILLFPCIEMNIGDDLFVMLLCKRFPNKDFLISSEAEYGSLKNINNLYFSKDLERYLFYTGRVPHNFLKKILYLKLGDYYRRKIGKYKIGLMIVGNAFKCYKYEGKTDSRWFEERMNLTDFFFLLSTNFGPYTNDQWRNDFRILFSKCKDICFRDDKSYELFRDLPNVRYAPDAVFSIGRIEQIERNQTIIISVINCLTPGRPTWLNKRCEEYENKLKEVIDILIEKKYKVILLTSNDDQDKDASERIRANIKRIDMVEIYHYKGDLDAVVQIYRQANGIISTRLHTMILGFLTDIPVFPIVYDEKVEGILKSIKFTGQFEYIQNMSEIQAEKIVAAIENYNYKLSENVIGEANMQFAGIEDLLIKEERYGH